jgi:predicted MFS family arabinose efflux permease
LDYDLWPVYLIGFIAYIPTGTIGLYLTILLKRLGWSTFNVNLLTIPHNLLHILGLLYITKLSEHIDERSLVALVVPVWLLPLLAILCWWQGSMINAWGTWLLCNLILGAPYIHAICVSWVSRNSGSIRTRAVSSAMYNISVQLGGIVAANIYDDSDAPLYRVGNHRLFWILATLAPLLILAKVYYKWRNHCKDVQWSSMDSEQISTYIKASPDRGNKRLEFRFAS